MAKSKKQLYDSRPTSPHLGIYRWQISNSLSILHRLTGVGLFISTLVLCWWGIIAVYSNYNTIVVNLISTIYFKIIILLTYLALSFHLSNGIRHLFWDMGYGYAKNKMHTTGWLAVSSTLILTVIMYYYILS